ncbi:MAG: dTDP-glucose 4,6-dehydratase [Magnetospirillum gryphiswaldense]|nr:dTDP-glucose 4,6-dehydratase [Magnetospirillum gryphiswaldense]
MTLLLTGAAGFIGSALTRACAAGNKEPILALDRMGYASNLAALPPLPAPHSFIQADIRDTATLDSVLTQHRPRAIVHLAAETHVDRSIDSPADFIDHNIVGSFQLLEAARRYWQAQGCPEHFRFIHVSTDEVFGSLQADEPAFGPDSPYRPNSPYSASKAASDHLARAWHATYGLPVMVTNCSNNYGPWQFPEKLMPLIIQKALAGQPLPIYGDGRQRRDWIYVDDHVAGLMAALERGRPGATYLFGAGQDQANLDVVHALCDELDRQRPSPLGSYRRLITFVADRPGHDRRYAIDSQATRVALDWQPQVNFAQGVTRTVRWCLDNPDWARRDYAGQRLGLG